MTVRITKILQRIRQTAKIRCCFDYGMHKEELQDLIMFYSSSEKKLVTLSEYVDRMKEDQKFIYFATGENAAAIDTLPQTELIRSKGYEILLYRGD